ARSSKNSLDVYWGQSDGTFSGSDSNQFQLAFSSPQLSPVVVDVDGNGSKSLAVLDYNGGVTLLRNMRSSGNSRDTLVSPQAVANWHLPSGVHPDGVATGDFDSDGKTDLVVSYGANGSGFALLPGSLATAKVTHLSSTNTVGGIAVGYLNNDANLD